MSPTNGHVTKLFLELEFQNKENKRKNAISQQNLAVFLAGTDSENKKYLNTTQERTNKILDKIVIIRTGTYL